MRKIFNTFFSNLLLILIILSTLPASGKAQALPDSKTRNLSEVYPQFIKWLKERNIGLTYSPVSMDHLRQETKSMLKKGQERIDHGGEDIDKDDEEEKIKFLQHSLDFLTGPQWLRVQDLTQQEKQVQFDLGLRSLYSVLANEYEENTPKTAAERKREMHNLFMAVKQLATPRHARIYRFSIPNLWQKMGLAKAQCEADNLVVVRGENPVQPSYVHGEQMAQMTPIEVAHLDISESHHMWHSQEYMLKDPDTWGEREQDINKKITKHLNKKFKINERFPQFRYDLLKAQKVLFFEGVRVSGSSAKVDVRDAFNVKWKMKWGEEVQPEVIAGRLYMAAGGKHTDLVYAQPTGEEGVVLILPDQKAALADKKNKDKCIPTSALELVHCLKGPYPRFKFPPFIADTGIISSTNLKKILRQLPPEAIDKNQAQLLLGRTYVTFKESLLEFAGKQAILRGGPASNSRYGATTDRVMRGLFLFNAWIKNGDVKDGNNKSFLLDMDGKEQYVEGQHDMGNSMGTVVAAGNINEINANSQFIRTTGNALYFDLLSFYLPKAYKHTTYADLHWMAQRIARISVPQITAIAAQTQWPSFMQKAVVYKFVSRRNRLAKMFGLTHLLDEKSAVAPTVQVPLYSPQLRQKACTTYGIPCAAFEKAFLSKKRSPNYTETPLYAGHINNCAANLLIRMLHFYRHPTGLDRRFSRLGYHRIFHPHTCGGV